MKERQHLDIRDKWFPVQTGMSVLEYALRWWRTIMVGAAVVIGIPGYIGNNIEYSEGTRVGVINKFSRKGLFWKSYEGQMALEGIVSDGKSVGANVWDFSIDRTRRYDEKIDELAKKLQDATEKNTKVRVTYNQTLFTWPWRSSSGYHIQSIEPLEKQ